ncbi:MAG TPA: hypothetical protein VFG83_15340, partial [Kofleriaceae bacterium]|nr:hypothetical protein [Kofleriaceae bacterium]
MRKALFAAALCAVAVTIPARAHADEPAKKPDYKAAKQHYIAAEKAGKAGHWKVAASEFQIAYDLTGDPVLFYKIADANDRAGNCDAMIRYFRRYLQEAAPTTLLRKHVKQRIEACGGDPDAAPATDTTAGGDNTTTTKNNDTGGGLYAGEVETPQDEGGDTP